MAGAGGLAELLEEALLFAHEAIEGHVVLQKILQTEPELLLPRLSVDNGPGPGLDPGLPPARGGGPRPAPGRGPGRGHGLPSRMVLSFIAAQGRWDLTDRASVRRLVQTELLAGL